MYFRLEKKEAQKKKNEYQFKIILIVNPKIRDVKNSLNITVSRQFIKRVNCWFSQDITKIQTVRENCDIGLKSDVFGGILPSKQFMY